jgi:peptidoglycan/xylan/chitin deacetylase (PgdA/CDA1 family)
MSSELRALQTRPPSVDIEPALILLYHRVASLPLDPFALCVSPEHFSGHMEVLTRLGVATPLREVGASAPPRDHSVPSVVITFDDGYADNIECAMPILERFGIPATFFVVTGGVDTGDEFWWDQLERAVLVPGEVPQLLELDIAGTSYHWNLGASSVLGDTEWQRHREWRAWEPSSHARFPLYWELWQLLHPLPTAARDTVVRRISDWAGVPTKARASHRRGTIEQLTRAAASPLVEIGAHTVNHVSLGQLQPGVQWREIMESRRALQSLLGVPVGSFSYPFGKEPDVTAATVELAREAGFDRACVNLPGVVNIDTDPMMLPRVHVPDLAPADFEWWLRAQGAV